MKILIKTVIIPFSLFLVSFSGKLNKDNYDKISNDMSVSQVESILGKGESQASSNVDLGEYGGNISSEVMTSQSDKDGKDNFWSSDQTSLLPNFGVSKSY